MLEAGSFAEWVSGIGTLLAVLVAMAVATRDSRVREKNGEVTPSGTGVCVAGSFWPAR